jgi:hypothetical protein
LRSVSSHGNCATGRSSPKCCDRAAIFSAPVVALALLLPLTHPSGLLLAGLLVVAMAVQWVFTFRGWWRTPEGQAKLQTVLAIDHTDSAA